MGNAITHPEAPDPGRKAPARPDQSPAESPDPPVRDEKADRRGRWPPDSLPNPMPGLDPQQTPGIDRLDGPRLAAVCSARLFFHQEHL